MNKKIKQYPNRLYKDPDVVIPRYNLIEYSENYSKRSARLW